MCVTYAECVSVALLIQHKKRMRRVIWSYVTCPTEQYLSILSHNQHDFRKQKLLIIRSEF